MRRDICRHSDCDTGSAVYKKVRESGRQYSRLFLGLIEVRDKVNGIFIDVRQHLNGDLAESRLGVSHGSGTVAIDRTKVSVSVYEHVAHGPFLSHVYQCSVDGAVSVRMIFTHGIADDTGALSVGLIRTVVQFRHGVKDTSLYRF